MERYISPEMEVTVFDVKDIITDSTHEPIEGGEEGN